MPKRNNDYDTGLKGLVASFIFLLRIAAIAMRVFICENFMSKKNKQNKSFYVKDKLIFHGLIAIKKCFVFLFLFCFFFDCFNRPVYALPEVSNVENGDVTFEQPNSSTMNITAADKAVINFKSFDIAQNEAVNFIQSSSSAVVLSRVSGSGPSQIAGLLTANGTLFLVNPNGIHFTPTAQVHVNALVASTLDISTNNFIQGNYIFDHVKDGDYAQVLNQGMIEANQVALLGSGVRNAGIITAVAGTVHLASGDKTTLTIDRMGLIHVEINEATSGAVIDLETGETVKEAVANTGTIEAHQVIMNAQTASDIFEHAVNQTGVVKATTLVEENGVIRLVSNQSIAVEGRLEAQGGQVSVVSEKDITVKGALETEGQTSLEANENIYVNADVTTRSGDLAFAADFDFNGTGSFLQSAATTLETLFFGSISICSSGESTFANIISCGDLIFKAAGEDARYRQHPDSNIEIEGALRIDPQVTVNAGNGVLNIGGSWINLGVFNPGTSTVSFVSDRSVEIIGTNIFYNLYISVPGKIVKFSPEDSQTIVGILTLKGEYGNLLRLESLTPGEQWQILPQGETDIAYILVGDSLNIRGPPLKGYHCSSSGNLTHWDLDPFWTGEGLTSFWSDPDNWDTGTVPTIYDIVTFDGVTGNNPNKDSFIDENFQGTVEKFTIDGYLGTITFGRDLTVTGDFAILSGVLNPGPHSLNIGGNWSNLGGSFEAGTSTVVFYDASKSSTISGNTTFHNLTCVTPAKTLIFEANSLTTVENTLILNGTQDNYITLQSSVSAKGSEFGIYVNEVSDGQGHAYLNYLNVYYSIAYGPAVPILVEEKYIPAELNVDWDDTHTWTGTVSGLWNNADNWGGSLPSAGDDLVFPSALASGQYSTTNDFAAETSFKTIVISGSGYTLAGNSITITTSITDSVASGNNTISLDLIFAATRTITVTNAAETLTFSGVLSGAGGLTKAGSGVLAVTGTNTYTGTTTISAGTLNFTSGSMDNSSNFSFKGGTLQYATGNTQDVSARITNSTSAITINTNDNNVTFASIIDSTNTGGLTKNGSGALTLSAANTFTGTVRLNSVTDSVLNINNAQALGNAANTFYILGSTIDNTSGSPITMLNYPQSWYNVFTFTGTNDLNMGAGTVTLTGGGPGRGVTVTAGELTIDGVITSSVQYNFTKAGDGTLTLNGANTFLSYTVYHNAGTLNINNSQALGDVSNPIRFAGGNIGNTSGSAITTLDYLYYMAGNGFTFTGSDDLNLGEGGMTVYYGPRTLTFTIDSDNLIFGGNLGLGTGFPLLKDGAGTLTITGSNTHSAATTINDGTLCFNSGSLGTGDIAFTGGTLQYASGNTQDVSSRIKSSTSAVVIDTNGNDVTFASALAATNVAGLTKIGSGTLTLGTANSYSGDTTINVGTLSFANGSISGSDDIIFTGGTLRYASGNTQDISGRIKNSTSAVVIDTNSNDVTFASVVDDTNTGGLTKAGSGTLTLTAANTYTGTATISAGILLCGIDESFLSANVSVASGATLDLAGYDLTLAGATSFVNSGTLKLTGDETISTVTLNAGSIVEYGATSGTRALQDWTYDNAVLNIAGSGGTFTLPGGISCVGLNISAGTLSQGANTMTIGATGITVSGGTFTGGSSAITCAGDFTLSSGTFTSTSNTFSVGGDWTHTDGIFTHNDGTVDFTKGSDTQTLTYGVDPFYNLTHSGAGTLVLTAAWLYTKQIVIDHSLVANTDQSAFPLLVYFASDADLVAYAQADGDDIIFTDADGTRLSHEIEKYDSDTGELFVWVKIPTLSASLDTVITLHYGNAACSSQQDSEGTWSSDYEGVWHLDSSLWLDSSVNANAGTGAGNVTTTSSGKIGIAGSFDGSGDYIYDDSPAGLPSGNVAKTISAWFYLTATGLRNIGGFGNNAAGNNFQVGSSSANIFTVWGWAADWITGVSTASYLNAWHHVAVTYDGTNTILYLDGNWAAQTAARVYNTDPVRVVIGEEIDKAGHSFSGSIDEFNIASTDFSADWVKTSFNNQNSPAGYQAVGAQQGGSLTVVNNLAISNGTFTSTSGTISVGNNFTNSGGIFTHNSGTVAMIASASGKTITTNDQPFNNLTFNGVGGAWTLQDNLTAAGTITIENGTLNQGANVITVADLTQTGGTFTGGSSAITLSGDFTLSGGSFTSTSDTFSMTGSFTQSGATFDGADGSISVGTDFTLSGGAFTSTSGTLSIGGDWTKSGGTFTHNSGTVDFTKGSGTQTLDYDLSPFYNLSHSGAGTLVLSPQWSYSKRIVISKDVVCEVAQTNFPLLIYFSSDANLAANAQADGDDIAFTGADGLQLSHEIESYNSGTGALWVWVKIPSLSVTADTVLYIHYGNAACSSQQDAENVWDENYLAVWHLNQTAGGAAAILDSTANNNTGTDTGSPTFSATGKVGTAISFDGLDDRIDTILDVDQSGDISVTMEAWVNPLTASASGHYVLSTDNGGYDWSLHREADSWSVFTGSGLTSTGLLVDTETWQYMSYVFVPGTGINFYKDTAERTTSTISYDASDTYLDIGDGSYYTGGYFDGTIDEVRISNIERSSEWLATCYNNQNSPASYQTVGAQQGGSLTVVNNLAISNGTFTSTSGTISVGNNFTNSGGIFTHNSGTVAMIATASGKTITTNDQSFNNLIFNGVGGAWTLQDNLTAAGTITIENGTLNQGANTITTANLTQTGATFTGGSGAITLSGDFTLSGGVFTSTSGTFSIAGDWSQTDGVFAHNDGTLDFTKGSGTQTFTFGVDPFYNLTHSGAGTLVLSAAWPYAKEITIDHTMVANTDQTNFPVLIYLSSDSDLAAYAQSDGDDIAFTGSDGSRLSHEIEKYDSGTGELWAWVKIPALSASSDTTIYLHYGNASCSSQESNSGTWSNDFSGVWHLSESSGNISDSSGNGLTGVANGSPNYSQAGEVANAIGNPNTAGFTATNATFGESGSFTVSAWYKYTGGYNGSIISRHWSGATGSWVFGMRTYRPTFGSSQSYINGVSTVTDAGWHYLTGVFVPGDTQYIYVDGKLDNSGAAGTITDTAYNLTLFEEAGGGWNLVSNFDEITISSTQRSADWIKTSFNNQLEPGHYQAVGSQSGGHLTIANTLTLSGGAFTSTSGTLSVGGNFTSSGETFTHNSGTVNLIATAAGKTITANNQPFYNLIFNGAGGAWTLQDNLTAEGTITIENGTLNQGANTISAANLTQTGGAFAGSASAITLSGDFTLSGGTFTSTSGTLSVGGDWNDFGGTFTHNNGTIDFTKDAGTQVFTTIGNQTYYNVTHSGAGTLQLSLWKYRKQVTLDVSMTTNTDQTDFPVLVYRAADADLAAGAQSSGDDIFFTSSDGATKLSHEIEYYDSATGELWAWVKIPSLSASLDTTLYMYYGNTVCSSQQDSTGVWDTNFVGVWHQNETSGTSVSDSTSYSNTGTATNVTMDAAGIADGADTYNTAYTDVGDAKSVNYFTNTITLEAWVKITGTSGVIVGKSRNAGHTNPYYEYCLYNLNTGRAHLRIDAKTISGSTVINNNVWHYVVGVYDGTNLRLYVDGGSDAAPVAFTEQVEISDRNLRIGCRDTTTLSEYINGTVDEVRVSNTARSADWIATNYNNISDPETYEEFGPESNRSFNVANDLSISAGTFDLNNCDVNVSGAFSVDGTVKLTGDEANVTAPTLNATSTVEYSATSGTRDIKDWTYTNAILKINGSGGAFTLPDDVTCAGVDITAGTFDLSAYDANVAGSWANAGTFIHNDQTVTFSGSGAQTLNAGSSSFYSLIHSGLGTLQLITNDLTVDGALNNSGGTLDINGRSLTVTGAFTIANSATLKLTGDETVSTPTLNATSTVEYSATSGTRDIKNWTYTNAILKINGNGGTFTLPAVLTCAGINISAGTLNAAGYTINVSGDWTNSGTFTHNDNTVNFTGTTDQAITTNSQPFYNLTLNNTGASGFDDFILVGPLVVDNILTVSDGDLNQGANNISMGSYSQSGGTFTGSSNAIVCSGDFTLSGGTFTSTSVTLSVGGNWSQTDGTFTHNSGTVDFTKESGTQTLGFGIDPFYNLVHSGAGILQLSPSWSYMKTVAISSSMVANTDQTNFPVLIYINADANIGANAQGDGDDLVFTDASGNRLAHEIEYYNVSGGNATAYIWVKVPTLSASSDTTLYLHYGNGTCSSQQNATAVWDSNYAGVWHLDETSGQHSDSTSYANNSTTVTVTTQGSVTGQIDGADEFNGTNQYVEINDSPSLSITGDITIEAWIRPDNYSNWRGITGKTTGTGRPAPYDFYLFKTGDAYPAGTPRLIVGNGTVWDSFEGSNVVTAGVLHYIVVTMSGTTVTHYLDGATNGSGTVSTTIADAGGTLRIGNRADLVTDFDGIIDEVRISNSARSSDYVTTSYNNQNNPSGYQTVGSQTANTLTVANNLTNSNGTLDANNYNLAVAGIFTNSSATLELTGDETISTPILNAGSTVEYSAASGTRDIKNWTYTNAILKINGNGGTFTLPEDVTCSGLDVSAGTLDTNSHNLAVTGTSSISLGAILLLDGTSGASALTIFDTLTNSGTLTLENDANTLSIIGSGAVRTFTGNDIDYNTNAVTLTNIDYDPDVSLDEAGDAIVLGDANCVFDALSIGVGGVVSTFNAGAYNFALSGNFTNTATGVFTSTGTATFNGGSNQTVTPGGTDTDHDFQNLTHTGAGNLILGGAIDIDGTLTQNNASSDIDPSASNYSITAANLTLTDGTINTNARGGTWTISGNLTILSGTLTGPVIINLEGSWSNSGIFNHNSGVVNFTTVTASTISGNTTFNNLTCIAAGKTLNFGAGDTQTIAGILTLTGASGNLLVLRSVSSPTQWRIDPRGTRDLSYLDVKDSNNINASPLVPVNSISSGNNTNWTFGKDFSGTVYIDAGVTVIGANKTVAIAVNGGAIVKTVETDVSGEYALTGVDVSDGDVIIVYLDNEAEKGSVVSVVTNSAYSGFDIYQNRVIVRHDYTTGYTTNADLSTADNGDTDIKYSVSSGNLVVEPAQELFVWSGDTYQPQGNVTTPHLNIRGTLNAQANTLTMSGNFVNSGTFTQGTSAVVFEGAGVSVVSGSTTFYDLRVMTAGKVLTLSRGTTQTVTHVLTLMGASDNPMTINDTGAGALPKLILQSLGEQSISDVNVLNNDASGGIQLVARGTSTITGTLNWILGSTGTVFTWTGTVSTDWNDPFNWDLGVVPSSTDIVVIPPTASRQPVLSGDVTIKDLEVEEDTTMTTDGSALNVVNDMVLNGTLNAANSIVTVTGNLTTSGSGMLEGTEPVLTASGYIGTKDAPLELSVTGAATISARGMNNMVSVSVNGAGQVDCSSSIPGFVYINGRVDDKLGQSQIRSSLSTGTSQMYADPMNSYGSYSPQSFPVMSAVLAGSPQMPMAIPVAASILATPVMVQPVASIEPAIAPSAVVPKPSFEGAGSLFETPAAISPEEFAGAVSQITIPEPQTAFSFKGSNVEAVIPLKPSFEGIQAGSQLPAPGLSKSSFEGIKATSVLSSVGSQDIFTGVKPEATLITPVTQQAFQGSGSQIDLPNPVIFDGVSSKAVLPQPVVSPSFEGVRVDAALPSAREAAFDDVKADSILTGSIDFHAIEAAHETMNVKVVFPGGQQITAIQGLGVPLGAEKPLLEPRIKANEDEE